MILSIITAAMKIGALILGNAYLAKWLGYYHLWLDKIATPELKRATETQYQILNKEFEDVVNRRPPV